jgi:hypothetical protein
MALLVFGSINASAQDSTNKVSGIITKKTFVPYKMEGKRISGQQFKEEIYKVPAAIPFYKKAKTSQIIGSSFFIPLTLIALFGDPNKYHSRDSLGRFRLRGYYVGLLLSEASIIYFFFRSNKFYKKAIRARNSALKTIY